MTADRDDATRDAAPEAGERKERVLHTRVPQSLERQLKQRAQSLGMSVSTVVRHVLLNTFGLVEDIVTDTTNVALSIAGVPPTPSRRPGRDTGSAADASDVLAWQEVVLHRNAVCEHCNDVLRRGARAAIAVREAPGPRSILCRRCFADVAKPRTTAKRGKPRRSRTP